MRLGRGAAACLWLAAGGAVMLTAAEARAQVETRVDLQTFEPALLSGGYLTLLGTDVPAHLEYGVGLVVGYQREPLVVSIFDTETWSITDDRVKVVRDQIMGHLVGSFGLLDRFSARLVYPFAFWQSGAGIDPLGMEADGVSVIGGGDLRLHLKSRLYGEGRGLSLAVDVGATFPTAFGDFLGNGAFSLHPRLDIGFRWGPVRAGVEVGYLFVMHELDPLAADREIFSTGFGDQMTFGGAAAVRIHDRIEVIGELAGRYGLSRDLDETNLEVDGAVRIRVTNAIAVTVGGGAGLMRGIGTPVARGFAGVVWEPTRSDRDGDGLVDRLDDCPMAGEDLDGFEDGDGCPELDNDGDGVPDATDPCPDTPGDSFSATPGCALDDEAASAAGGTGSSAKTADPAAMGGPDTDGDGIPDAIDRCGGYAEDFEPPEPSDGCPLAGTEGKKTDVDADGVPDLDDKCPTEKESINGAEDDDGCPDEDRALVLLPSPEADHVELRGPVAFKVFKLTTGDEVIADLARLLNSHPEIGTIRIEAAAKKPKNARLRAKAIKTMLTKLGVTAKRMEIAAAPAGAEPLAIKIVGTEAVAPTPEAKPRAKPKAKAKPEVAPVPVPEKKPDADGDGVPDDIDECPGAKEDFEPPEPSDGCPF